MGAGPGSGGRSRWAAGWAAGWARWAGALGAAAVAVPRALLGWLPASAVVKLGRGLGACWHGLVPVRRRTARTQLAAAFPDWAPAAVRAAVAESYRHLGALVAQALLAPGGAPSDAEIVDAHHLTAASAAGRGVLVLSAHLGDFERLVRAPTLGGRRLWVVTRRFRSAWAEGAWRRARRGGAGLFAAGEGAQAVRAALRRGEAVAYVLDQHTPPGRAVWVPFFGRPAATSPDLARLARLTGAPVVPVFTAWRGGRPVIWAEPPVDLPRTADAAADALEGTRRCAAVVEAAVRRHPAQWLWIHRRWKAPPADVAAALARAPDGCVGRRRGITAVGIPQYERVTEP